MREDGAAAVGFAVDDLPGMADDQNGAGNAVLMDGLFDDAIELGGSGKTLGERGNRQE